MYSSLLINQYSPFLVRCSNSPANGESCSSMSLGKAAAKLCASTMLLSHGLIDAFLFASFGNLDLRAASPLKAFHS